MTEQQIKQLHDNAYELFRPTVSGLHFDGETTCVVIDQSGKGNHGTIHGDVRGGTKLQEITQ